MGLVLFIFLFILSTFIYFELKEIKLLNRVTGIRRGTKSERKLVVKLLKHGVPEQTIFHDLYIEIGKSRYCQIDLVVATRTGIIVFEVKEYNGWIFGNSYRKQWIQILAYGNVKHRFYNPIMQNEKHIQHLRKKLPQFEKVPFYSVIVFYGNCEFKNDINVPNKTYIVYSKDVLNVVKMINENEQAKYQNKREVVELFKKGALNGKERRIRNEHIRNIRSLMDARNIN